MTNNILENLSAEQNDLNARIFNLILARVLKVVYLNCGEKGKQEMEKSLLSDDDGKKEDFIKKYIPNFQKVFEEETKKFKSELEIEISKQI